MHGSFPDLQIISRDDLLLHEDVDMERVARLLDRLSTDGVLRNPPIVASLPGSDRYLLLDGANRVSALKNLDISHLLVQVEPYDNEELKFRHWNHVVRDVEARELLQYAHNHPGGVTHSKKDASDKGLVATIRTAEGKVLNIVSQTSLSERVRFLRSLVNIYYTRETQIDRVNHVDLDELTVNYPNFGALVSFPDFSKAEVRLIAEASELLPSGVTRILVPRRVLGFNLGLSWLKSGLSLAEKRGWLKDEIQQKRGEHRVRYYQEPTVIFDD